MDWFIPFAGICVAYGFIKGLMNPRQYGIEHPPEWSRQTLRAAGAYRLLRGWRH